MTTYTSNLGLALPVTGDLTGTWGQTVNDAITSLLDSAVAGTTTLNTDADVTLTDTTGAANQSRQAIIRWTAGGTVTRNITAPARTKVYVVINATSGSQSIVFRGAGPTTGVTLVPGERALVVWNGTDFAKASSSTLNAYVLPGTNGNVLTSNGTTWTSAAVPPGGLVYTYTTTGVTATDKQGVLADTSGGAFTVTLPATPTTGMQVVVADAGASWGTNNLTVGRNGSTIGGLAENLVCDITGASVQLVYDGTTWEVYAQIGGNGGNAVTLSGVQTLTNKTIAYASNTLTGVAGTGVANTFTATQTLQGSSSALAAVLTDAAEVATVSATAATGTINYDITTQSVLFYTTNASANWTVNLRASAGTSLNTAMSTGQSVTVAFLVTNGATAYYNTAVQVDGTTSGVTTRWQGGAAPTAGNASSVDIYVYTIIKTASATFSVFASQTRFA